MDNLTRIRKTSRALYLLCTVSLVVIPLLVVFYWVSFNSIDWIMPRVIEGPTRAPSKPVPTTLLLFCFAITMLPALLITYALQQLRRLFQLYVDGRVFTLANCICLRNLSIALLAWTPVRLIFDALISLTLTSINPPDQRFIALSIKEPELTTMFLGLIFLVIAWVMAEARRLQEDNAGII